MRNIFYSSKNLTIFPFLKTNFVQNSRTFIILPQGRKNQVDLHFPNGTISTRLKEERETIPLDERWNTRGQRGWMEDEAVWRRVEKWMEGIQNGIKNSRAMNVPRVQLAFEHSRKWWKKRKVLMDLALNTFNLDFLFPLSSHFEIPFSFHNTKVILNIYLHSSSILRLTKNWARNESSRPGHVWGKVGKKS